MALLVGARVYNSGALTITNNTLTALTFDSERFDTDTIHSTASNTSRLTATTAGKYAISGHIEWAANATGHRLIAIRLNGTTSLASIRRNAISGGAATEQQSIATIYELAVNDYVELHVLQTSGGNLNVNAAGNYSPEFSMHRVG